MFSIFAHGLFFPKYDRLNGTTLPILIMKQPCSEYLSDDFLDFATTCNDVVLPVSTYTGVACSDTKNLY